MEHLKLLVSAYHRRNTNITNSDGHTLTTIIKSNYGRGDLYLIRCIGRDLNSYLSLLLILLEGSPQVKLVKVG